MLFYTTTNVFLTILITFIIKNIKWFISFLIKNLNKEYKQKFHLSDF